LSIFPGAWGGNPVASGPNVESLLAAFEGWYRDKHGMVRLASVPR
jgi:hypothetical protein